MEKLFSPSLKRTGFTQYITKNLKIPDTTKLNFRDGASVLIEFARGLTGEESIFAHALPVIRGINVRGD